jgi:hypothetical protein
MGPYVARQGYGAHAAILISILPLGLMAFNAFDPQPPFVYSVLLSLSCTVHVVLISPSNRGSLL